MSSRRRAVFARHADRAISSARMRVSGKDLESLVRVQISSLCSFLSIPRYSAYYQEGSAAGVGSRLASSASRRSSCEGVAVGQRGSWGLAENSPILTRRAGWHSAICFWREHLHWRDHGRDGRLIVSGRSPFQESSRKGCLPDVWGQPDPWGGQPPLQIQISDQWWCF